MMRELGGRVGCCQQGEGKKTGGRASLRKLRGEKEGDDVKRGEMEELRGMTRENNRWKVGLTLSAGFFTGRPEKLPDLCYSWWVLAALKMIGRIHWISKVRAGDS